MLLVAPYSFLIELFLIYIRLFVLSILLSSLHSDWLLLEGCKSEKF